MLPPRRRGLKNAFPGPPSQSSFPPHGPWDKELCSVQGTNGHCRTSASGQDHSSDSFISPLALAPWPWTQVFYQCLLNKGGKLISHSRIIPILTWNLQNPFSVPSSQRKAGNSSRMVVPPFFGFPSGIPVCFSYFPIGPFL